MGFKRHAQHLSVAFLLIGGSASLGTEPPCNGPMDKIANPNAYSATANAEQITNKDGAVSGTDGAKPMLDHIPGAADQPAPITFSAPGVPKSGVATKTISDFLKSFEEHPVAKALLDRFHIKTYVPKRAEETAPREALVPTRHDSVPLSDRGVGSPVFLPGGEIVIATRDGEVNFFRLDNQDRLVLIDKVNLGRPISSPPTVLEDGTLAVADVDGYLSHFHFDPSEAKAILVDRVSVGDGVSAATSLGDGRLAVVTGDELAIVKNEAGGRLRSRARISLGRWVNTAPVMTSTGAIVVGMRGGEVAFLKQDGDKAIKVEGKVQLNHHVSSLTPLPGEQGTVIACDGALHELSLEGGHVRMGARSGDVYDEFLSPLALSDGTLAVVGKDLHSIHLVKLTPNGFVEVGKIHTPSNITSSPVQLNENHIGVTLADGSLLQAEVGKDGRIEIARVDAVGEKSEFGTKATVTPDGKLLLNNSGRLSLYDLKPEPQEPSGEATVVLADVSNSVSMHSDRAKQRDQIISDLVSQRDQGGMKEIIPFAHRVHQSVEVTTADQAQRLMDGASQEGGGTDVQQALERALAGIEQREKTRHRPLAHANIVLVTDGGSAIDIAKLKEARAKISPNTEVNLEINELGDSAIGKELAAQAKRIGFNRVTVHENKPATPVLSPNGDVQMKPVEKPQPQSSPVILDNGDIAVSGDGKVFVMRPVKRKMVVLGSFKSDGPPTRLPNGGFVIHSPEGKVTYVSSDSNGKVQSLEIPHGKETTLPTGGKVSWTPEGKLTYQEGNGKPVTIEMQPGKIAPVSPESSVGDHAEAQPVRAKLVHQIPTLGDIEQQPLELQDGRILFAQGDYLEVYSEKDGKFVQHFHLGDKLSSPPILLKDGSVAVATQRGRVYRLHIKPDGSIRADRPFQLDGPVGDGTYTQLTELADGRLAVGTHGRLWIIEPKPRRGFAGVSELPRTGFQGKPVVLRNGEIAVAGRGEITVVEPDKLEGMKNPMTAKMEGPLVSITPLPDGHFIAADGALHEFEVKDGALVEKAKSPAIYAAMAPLPLENGILAVVGSDHHSIHLVKRDRDGFVDVGKLDIPDFINSRELVRLPNGNISFAADSRENGGTIYQVKVSGKEPMKVAKIDQARARPLMGATPALISEGRMILRDRKGLSIYQLEPEPKLPSGAGSELSRYVAETTRADMDRWHHQAVAHTAKRVLYRSANETADPKGESNQVLGDVSGSMGGKRAKQRDEIISEIARWRKPLRLTFFDNEIQYSSEVKGAEEAQRAVQQARSGGGTDIEKALIEALANIKVQERVQKRALARANITLVTDGESPIDIAKLKRVRSSISPQTQIELDIYELGGGSMGKDLASQAEEIGFARVNVHNIR